jgi:glycosyltransferase involved in cell wall biosynthesis
VTGALALAAVGLALLPALMVLWNLTQYRRARPWLRPWPVAEVVASVLIPARNEARNIADCIHAVLASRGAEVEVVVLDDASSDDTAAIVETIAALDSRVTLVRGEGPPAGWNGKQYACQRLADAATHGLLLFVDADVRLRPDAVRRLGAELRVRRMDLLSGVPHQRTSGWFEAAVVPLIHFVLLGYLPIWMARRSTSPGFAAGCGQLMLVDRDAYVAAGGHAGLRESRHDGLQLPRRFRAAGRRTDLVDATDLAECRMYESASAAWQGFAKNADEGMGSARAIVPWTALLGGGQVLPWILMAWAAFASDPGALALAVIAATLGILTRAGLALRFRQPVLGVVLHPLGVALLIAIQWYALVQRVSGRQVAWRGRAGVEGVR